MVRLTLIGATYFIYGISEVFVGGLRGLGSSILPMVNSIMGICGIRLLWIYTIFKYNHTLKTLYISYPISWVITALVHMICYIIIYKNKKKEIFEISHA